MSVSVYYDNASYMLQKIKKKFVNREQDIYLYMIIWTRDFFLAFLENNLSMNMNLIVADKFVIIFSGKKCTIVFSPHESV